jgi:predicted RNA-binding protein with PIN domain
VLSCWVLMRMEMIKSAIRYASYTNLMPYLIDGHNLIPKLGLRLDSFDDELDLLIRLQEFCRLRRAQVEVYFDGAPSGQASTRKSGVVTAHFVRRGSSADAAIEARLIQLKKAAKNWTVVSSDGRVQRAARTAGAGAMSAEEFAQEMVKEQTRRMTKSKNESALSPDEVEEWLEFFEKRGREN